MPEPRRIGVEVPNTYFHIHSWIKDGVRAFACPASGLSSEFFRRRFGVRFYATVGEMLASEELDQVVLLPPWRDTSLETLHTAIRAGVAVLSTHPSGLTAPQWHELVRAAEGSSAWVGLGHGVQPHLAHAADLVRSGWLGRPCHLNLRRYTDRGRFAVVTGGRHSVDPELGRDALTLVFMLLGDVRSVVGSCLHPSGGAADDPGRGDAWSLILESSGGATASINVSTAAYEPAAKGDLQAWELHGSEGTIHVGATTDGGAPEMLGRRIKPGQEGKPARQNDRLAPIPAPEEPTAARYPTPRESWRIQQILDAANRSIAEDRRVFVDEATVRDPG